MAGAGLSGWIGGRRAADAPLRVGGAAAAGTLVVDYGLGVVGWLWGTRTWGIPGAFGLLALPVAGAYVGALHRTANHGSDRQSS